MARESKVRPSVTVKDCFIIANALDAKIMTAMESGQVSNPVVLRMAALKDYFLSFQSEEDRIEALVNARLAALGQPVTASEVTTNLAVDSLDSMIASTVSPIDREDLTDEQKFDLLAMRPELKRTEEENKWFLNVGTFVRMKRAGMNTKVSEGDL